MGLLDLFGKRNVSEELGKKMPFTIKAEFTPYHLKSKESSMTSLAISLTNITSEPVMGSVVIELPKQLSFDAIGVSKQKEVRLGTIAPNEEKNSFIDIHGGIGTDKGTYTITLTAFIHYRDYVHVLNEMRKRLVLEAV